jgi:hypothetical protein
MPTEFNIAFWVMPTDLSSKSFFINLFNRAYVWAESSNTRLFYKFQVGIGENDVVTPTNPADLND